MVVLALSTLATFDFLEFSESVIHFFDETVINYLDDDNSSVRAAAVKTCCTLSISAQPNSLGTVIESMVRRLIKKFLIVATTDSDHMIRSVMLKHMNRQFDSFIAVKENLHMLFNCMNDSSFNIRDRTLKILGRLLDYNRPLIYPYLRKLLMQYLCTLEYKSDHQEKEEALNLLITFITRCQGVAMYHVESLSKGMMERLKSEHYNSSLVTSLIEAVGELSNIDGKQLIPHLDTLVPLILKSIKD